MPILGIIASQNYNRVTNSYESIQTVTVGSGGSSSITFSSIPSTYTHLQIRLITKSANTAINWDSFYMTFNSDTDANYSSHSLRGSGASVSASSQTSASNILVGYQNDNGYTSGIVSPFIIDILDYKNTNKFKTTRTFGGFDSNNVGNGGEVGQIALTSGNWRSTTAISSIQLFAGGGRNTAQYSVFALYGIKGA
jgi:hypothetical protein